MIKQMTKYSFILLSGDQAKFLEELQEIGLVDITRASKPIDDESSALLSRTEDISKAINKLDSFDLSKDPDKEKISSIYISPVEDPVAQTFSSFNYLNELKITLTNAEREYETRKVWGEYDKKALKGLSELGYQIRFYSIKKKLFDKNWENEVPLQIINDNGDSIWFVTISDDPDYSFPLNELPKPTGTVEDSEKEIEILKDKIIACKGEINALKSFKEDLANEKEAKLKALDMYLANASSELVGENSICVFEGFAPSENDEQLTKVFDNMDIYYLKEKAKVEDNPPIQLKSNWFTKMFTVLTDMYGRPVYNEFDPTPYLSIFFLLFFAMCMGDAGYGIALIIIGLILKKKQSFADIAPLVTTLGVGTFVVGMVMHTFFGVDIAALSWIPAWMKKFMITGTIGGFEAPMVIAIIIGIIHLCLAMAVKTIYATKNQGFLNSLSTWGWTTLIVGGTIVGTLTLFNILPMAVTKWIIIIMGGLSAIGIFLLNDLHRNPLLNIGSGLWETYNTATGLLGDVLSYLRLYALGLAGSMLGQAFNQIAMMTIGNEFSLKPMLIVFVIIVLIGHTLNIAMCCLGAFVHPLRLNFLEFFKNSGYEGKGRTYKPISK